MIGSSLLRYNKEQIFLIWDTESTGLNLFYDRPWQLAWILFRDNEILDRQNYYIHLDNFHISPDAARISHFNERVYKENARDAREILPMFEKYLLDPAIRSIGHNIYFDSYMHTNLRRTIDLEKDLSYMDRMIDTNILAKAFKKSWQPDLTNFNRWQWRVSNYIEKGLKTNLNQTAKDMNIEVDETKLHGADYDIWINMLIFNQFKVKMEI